MIMQNKDLYILVQNDIEKANLLESQMFADLIHSPVAYVLRENSKDRVAALLAKRKVQKIFSKVVNVWLTDRYSLGQLLKEKSAAYDRIYVIFLNTAFCTVAYPAEVLRAYQKKWPQVRYILLYVDSVCRGVSVYANYLREKQVFDLVYSFDEQDAQSYGMIFWKTPYSFDAEFTGIKPERDIYFVGVGTDRFETLCRTAAQGQNAGMDIRMDIVCQDPETFRDQITDNISLYSFKEVLPYREVLKKTLQANCILEVIRPGQVGLTLRAYEAVVYNRKLLTNNKTILSFSYYDPRFMQYFEKVEDIDWDWVKEETEVDYHYNGEFSPLRLLEDIIASCEEK